jgi:DNA-binding transcriptional MerR regulator
MSPRPKEPHKAGYLSISEVARILEVSASTLRAWESMGLVTPSRSKGRYRLFSWEDVRRLKKIKYLKSAKQINSKGVLHVLQSDNSHRFSTTTKKTKSIGQKLRDFRLLEKMTLRDVAKGTDLSVGFLSSLERSQTNASVATLQKLSKLYNTNVLALFGEPETHTKLVRAAARKVLETQSGTRIEQLAVGQTAMEPHLFRLAPRASSGGSYHHDGEEFVYVLQGVFEIWLDEIEHYVLRAGDSLYFSSSQSHRWVNSGRSETTLLWINTPPTF